MQRIRQDKLAKAIKTKRKEMNLSQAELADKAGINRAALSKLENDCYMPSIEQLHKAVEDINKKMMNSEAVFGFHEKTNRVTIKIGDKKTKETIKELPPEKTLDMIAKVWEMAGIMVDEKR